MAKHEGYLYDTGRYDEDGYAIFEGEGNFEVRSSHPEVGVRYFSDDEGVRDIVAYSLSRCVNIYMRKGEDKKLLCHLRRGEKVSLPVETFKELEDCDEIFASIF